MKGGRRCSLDAERAGTTGTLDLLGNVTRRRGIPRDGLNARSIAPRLVAYCFLLECARPSLGEGCGVDRTAVCREVVSAVDQPAMRACGREEIDQCARCAPRANVQHRHGGELARLSQRVPRVVPRVLIGACKEKSSRSISAASQGVGLWRDMIQWCDETRCRSRSKP